MKMANNQLTLCKVKATKYHNFRVKTCGFQEGSLDLRKAYKPRKHQREGKLVANQKAPFIVMNNLGNVAYHQEQIKGKPFPRSQKVTHLHDYLVHLMI